MELKNQVVSLELAKRLKELGAKQESLFSYNGYLHSESKVEIVRTNDVDYEGYDCVSAFTVAELGEMLPEEYPWNSDSVLCCMKFSNAHWAVRYQDDVQESVVHGEMGDTEANARAKMLIYLIENKLITP